MAHALLCFSVIAGCVIEPKGDDTSVLCSRRRGKASASSGVLNHLSLYISYMHISYPRAIIALLFKIKEREVILSVSRQLLVIRMG